MVLSTTFSSQQRCYLQVGILNKANGSIERKKVHPVTKGFLQKFGIDFVETFSPVVKAIIIRLVLTLAITNSWPIWQFDMQNAFLHGPLTETIYKAQPPGFSHSQFPSYVCRLHKEIYGLR